MTRLQLYHWKPKRFYVLKWLSFLLFALIIAGLLVGFTRFSNSSIKIEAPKFSKGQKVVVHLPNGKEVYTFENLLVQEGDKLYYKNENNMLDLSGGKVEFKEWE